MGTAMKVSNLLMKGPLVRASLDGRKTQTRRLRGLEKVNVEPSRFEPVVPPQRINNPDSKYHDAVYVVFRRDDGGLTVAHCPWGGAGDLIYVREAWQAWTEHNYMPPRSIPIGSGINYLADGNKWDARYRQAMHMPRWASRLTLRITGVLVARLQDMSEGDAKAEGARAMDPPTGREVLLASPSQSGSYRLHFKHIWTDINGPDSWAHNPWVWVLEYSAIAANVDQVLREAA